MSLFDKLKENHLDARKRRDPVETKLYSYLIGEIQKLEKNNIIIKDHVVLNLLEKYKKDLIKTGEITNSDSIKEELDIINSLMPTKLTTDDMGKIIRDFVEKHPDSVIKDVLNYLDENYPNQYEKQAAVMKIKELIYGKHK